MPFPETEEYVEPRTLVSHFSARVRLVAFGVSLWGLGFLVAAAPGGSGPLVSIGSSTLTTMVLIAASTVGAVLLAPGLARLFAGHGASQKLRPLEAVPVLLVLCAVLLFFAAMNRREVFVGKPDALRLAADCLLAGGSLLGILSIAIGLGIGQGQGQGRDWRRMAAASLLVIGMGLAANAALYRNVASSSLAHADFWGHPYIRVCEDLGYALWVVFCAGILLWDPDSAGGAGGERIRWTRWIVLAAVGGFSALTLAGLLVVFLGVLEVSPSWYSWEEVVEPSHWSLALGRAAWYFLLLYLIPLVASGVRAVLRGRGAVRLWLVTLLPIAPVLVGMGMLVQAWVTAYGAWSGRGWWPIWIPCIVSIPILVLWLGGRGLRSRRALLTTLLAACLSLVAAGLWLWFRGPSLRWYINLQIAWRPIIRRVIPLTLMGAGLSIIPSIYRSIREPRRGLVPSPMPDWPAGPWPWAGWGSMLVCPSLVSGALLFGIGIELEQRIWLRYGTILPWSPFASSLLFATCIALAGSILSWRILLMSPGIGQPPISGRRVVGLRHAVALAAAAALVVCPLLLYYPRPAQSASLSLTLGLQVLDSGPRANVRCVNNGEEALKVAGFALGRSPQLDLRGPPDDWYRLVDPWSPSGSGGEEPEEQGLGPGATLAGSYDLLGLWRRLNNSELSWGKEIFRAGGEYLLVATYKPYPGDPDTEKAQTTLTAEFRFNTEGWPAAEAEGEGEVPFPIYITRQDQTGMPGNQGMEMITEVEDLDVARMLGKDPIDEPFERVGIFPEPPYIDRTVLLYFTNRSAWFKANAPDHPDFTENGWLRYTATIRGFNGTIEKAGPDLAVKAAGGSLELTGRQGTYWYDAQGETQIHGGYVVAMQLRYMEFFGNLGSKGIIVETQYAFLDEERKLVALITPQIMGVMMA